MQIRTARLIIRPLERADADAIHALYPHIDPLLAQYNVPAVETDEERDLWFALRTGDPTRQEFAVTTASGQFIGRIALREMDGLGSARLGIGIGAEFVNRGHGTEALTGFLDWYFGEAEFCKLVLDVSATNERAIHVYEKLGFRYVGERYREADQATMAFLDDPRSLPIRRYFRREDDHAWALYYEMELTREEWRQRME